MAFPLNDITTTRSTTDGLGRVQSSAPVYSGKAHIQERRIRASTTDGTLIEVGDAQAFPPRPIPSSWFDQRQGDDVEITFDDGTQEATIAETPRRLDGRMVLAYTES